MGKWKVELCLALPYHVSHALALAFALDPTYKGAAGLAYAWDQLLFYVAAHHIYLFYYLDPQRHACTCQLTVIRDVVALVSNLILKNQAW